jgi:hypothetical protein
MAQVLVTESSLISIGRAIRQKNGEETTYLPSEMADAIIDLPTYPEPTGTLEINENGTVNIKDKEYVKVDVDQPSGSVIISQNGTYDVKDKEYAIVYVENTFSTDDNGKVVVNGNLVEQTVREVFQNGVYDTTSNNRVVVNLPVGLTDDATLDSGDRMLSGYTAYANGVKYAGTIQTYLGEVVGGSAVEEFYSDLIDAHGEYF